MKTYQKLEELPKYARGSVVSVGNFDGVHLGHQAILDYARALANKEGLPLVAMTFEPAPVKVLRPEKAPKVITPLPIKLKLLAQQKVDEVIVVEATPRFLTQSAEDFAQGILANKLKAKHLVEGQTFSFGRHREGSMMSLEEMGKAYGFEAHLVPARTVCIDSDQPVAMSSTIIRRYLDNGQLAFADVGLGRAHLLAGEIVAGKRLGRKLGYPTANLKLYSSDQLVGQDGVFAGWARIGEDFDGAWQQERYYKAAISIGDCRTVEEGIWQIEAHLLDYPDNGVPLYQKHMLLSMVRRVRPQQKFGDLQDLTAQIAQDCAEIENILENRRHGT
ncbi:MAG: riboflavin biosynthesis protein RibF [Sedimentisphaerales bacterium]|nr:riboflavin biosynthesis protein RibF [Sedimentisphaerales bacterium]